MGVKAPLRVTAMALQHMRGLLTIDKPYVFIGVKGGGCNGLKYVVEACGDAHVSDERMTVEDVDFVVCGKSLMHLLGATITWRTDSMGSRLEFENPNAASRCGCGETFTTTDG